MGEKVVAQTEGPLSGQWLVHWMADGGYQVSPIGDLSPHDDGFGCWCRPYDDDGICVHNSMDRRELKERGEVRPS